MVQVRRSCRLTQVSNQNFHVTSLVFTCFLTPPIVANISIQWNSPCHAIVDSSLEEVYPLWRSKLIFYLKQMTQLTFFEPPIWSVTELTHYVHDLLANDDNLQDVWVQGEVSNFSRPTSGHLYFTLKDSACSLRCVMWKNAALRQKVIPREGDALEVHGSLNVYEAAGQYQLYADLIRPAGEGALYREFLRLKARLEAEGLFAPERKRPIPRWPHRIGIVTSPTGAALRDILHTLTRRYPLVEVVLAPTQVQGDEAPAGIVAAIQALNRVAHPDVILVARGGGSIEDLWAFNDEGVARAIAASTAPVISGVGHETDFTIADFVSDLRAPTPTAAAELSTPDRADLLASLDDMSQRMARAMQSCLNSQRWKLNRIESRLALRSPKHASTQTASAWTIWRAALKPHLLIDYGYNAST